jgi:hypothetical protein
MSKSDVFKKELGYIKDDKIREFTEKVLEIVPDYFWEIPSSSTGKFHPNYALNSGGLCRHVKACVIIANDLLELPMFKNIYQHKDEILSALFLHDCAKSNIPKQKFTAHEHPLIITNFIRQHKNVCDILAEDILDNILSAIESHMGFWSTNKYSKIVLPTPQTGMQHFTHMVDYLASRKFLELNFNAVS